MANTVLTVVSFIVLITYANACPKILTRTQWKARAPKSTQNFIAKRDRVVIHHSASQGCSTQAACAGLIRSFQNLHMDKNGWADIGYNFLIGGNGQIWQGRGWTRVGAHAGNMNSRSIGICLIGTFTRVLPTTAAMSAAQSLIACGVSSGYIASNYRLIGHGQVSTTKCPGNALFNRIKTWRNFGSP